MTMDDGTDGWCNGVKTRKDVWLIPSACKNDDRVKDDDDDDDDEDEDKDEDDDNNDNDDDDDDTRQHKRALQWKNGMP